MSNRMVIDDGISIDVEKLKARLKKKYPNHNFDVPPPPDTKCKKEYECKQLNNITYSDKEGNIYCGRRYKQTKGENYYQWEYRECHALIKPGKQSGEQTEIPF